MSIKTYRARTAAEALKQVKDELGPDAVILHTKTGKDGGLLGFGAKQVIEVTATTPEQYAKAHGRPPQTRTRVRPTRVAGTTEPTRSAKQTPAGAQSAQAVHATQQQPVVAASRTAAPVAAAAAPASATTAYAQRTAAHAQQQPAQGGSSPQALLDSLASHPELADTARQARVKVEAQPKAMNPAAPVADLQAPGQIPSQASNQAHASSKQTSEPKPAPAPELKPTASLVEPDAAALQEEMTAIRRMVGQVLRTQRLNHEGAMSEALSGIYMRLLESGLSGELADHVVSSLRDELSPMELAKPDIVERSAHLRLMDLIRIDRDPVITHERQGAKPKVAALVGPTGVGKTTTIAKLAAAAHLRRGKSVGLITCDTYRIAAVDQLRTYADIIGVQLEVALTPEEMSQARQKLSDRDLLIIDTPGRAPRDQSRLDELTALLDAAKPDDIHLALAATSGDRVLEATGRRFKELGARSIIFTKLDEAVHFGPLVNTMQALDLPAAYFTNGQEVPDHAHPATADRLARLVLEGEHV